MLSQKKIKMREKAFKKMLEKKRKQMEQEKKQKEKRKDLKLLASPVSSLNISDSQDEKEDLRNIRKPTGRKPGLETSGSLPSAFASNQGGEIIPSILLPKISRLDREDSFKSEAFKSPTSVSTVRGSTFSDHFKPKVNMLPSVKKRVTKTSIMNEEMNKLLDDAVTPLNSAQKQ